MARTSFTPTADGQTALYPEAGSGIQEASTEVTGNNRYSAAGLVEGTGVWQFPIENDAFNVPFLQFKFLDAFGNLFNNQRAPVIYLLIPNQFNNNRMLTLIWIGFFTFLTLITSCFILLKMKELKKLLFVN